MKQHWGAVATRRESDLILSEEAPPESRPLMEMPKAVKEHKGSKLEGANFLVLPPHPLSPRGTRRGKDNKACAPAAQLALPAAGPSRPRGARLPGGRAGAPERGRRQDRGGWGRGVPYLEQHKEPEQRQEAAAAARPRGQVPHRGVDGEPGVRWRRLAPRAAHNGELGLQPQTLGAEVAPGGRILPFQCPCACSPSAFCTRDPLGTRQARLFFNSYGW